LPSSSSLGVGLAVLFYSKSLPKWTLIMERSQACPWEYHEMGWSIGDLSQVILTPYSRNNLKLNNITVCSLLSKY